MNYHLTQQLNFNTSNNNNNLPVRIKLFGILPVLGIELDQKSWNHDNGSFWDGHSFDDSGLPALSASPTILGYTVKTFKVCWPKEWTQSPNLGAGG